MSAPSAARRSAMALPMPRDPPVMTADLPVRSIIGRVYRPATNSRHHVGPPRASGDPSACPAAILPLKVNDRADQVLQETLGRPPCQPATR